MNTPQDMKAPDAFTTCVVWAFEVPLDEAVVPEVTDQLVYLLGYDCYALWRGAAASSFHLPVS
jgi:uncharacterized protein DUF3330